MAVKTIFFVLGIAALLCFFFVRAAQAVTEPSFEQESKLSEYLTDACLC